MAVLPAGSLSRAPYSVTSKRRVCPAPGPPPAAGGGGAGRLGGAVRLDAALGGGGIVGVGAGARAACSGAASTDRPLWMVGGPGPGNRQATSPSTAAARQTTATTGHHRRPGARCIDMPLDPHPFENEPHLTQ